MKITAFRFSLFFLFFLLPAVLFAVEPGKDQPADLDRCKRDSDCVVVRHIHCCGTTKKSINVKYFKSYNAHPAWQRTDGEICAVIGQCLPNDDVTKARCDLVGTTKRCVEGARVKK